MPFKKVQRKVAKLRAACTGPSGSGKTLSSLYLAFGLRMTGTRSHLSTQNTEELSFTQIVLTSVQENFSMMN